MTKQQASVRLYFAPLSYPCGPKSSCCGPDGQSEEDVASWKTAIETEIPDVEVETIDVTQPPRPDRDEPVTKLLKSYGQQACPIIAIQDKVLSLGPPEFRELLAKIRAEIAPDASV